MTVTAKCLDQASYVPNSDTLLYTVPASTKAIIDKMSATNTDVGSQTITVYIVPSGQVVGAEYTITSAQSIGAGASVDLTEMKNQILESGDKVYAVASVASKVVSRISGREIT